MIDKSVLIFCSAIGVSGGPDSMALCVLAAHWKSENHNPATTTGRSKFIDGILAIVVDHGLRKESTEEANLVCRRIVDMGKNTRSFFRVVLI